MSFVRPSLSIFQQVGDHQIAIETDIVVVRIRGLLTALHARQFVDFAAVATSSLPGFFLLIDLTHMGSPPDSEARRLLVQWTKDRPPIAAAAIGGNLVLRTFASLANRATSLLSGKPQSLEFFAHEGEAQLWFAQHRHDFQQRSSVS